LATHRYADDAIVHCRTRREAEEVRTAVAQRLHECRLELHPEKTKIVYCKDEDRRGNYPNPKFDFLGYTFRPRKSKNRWGKIFVNFTPAISTSAAKAIRDEIRGWRLQSCSDKSIEDLSRMFNPIIRGWLHYYGRFYRSAVYLSTGQSAGALGVTEIQETSPSSTMCTSMGRPVVPECSGAVRSLADGKGRVCCGSRMNGDVHVRF
jgi:hypothetical protein